MRMNKEEFSGIVRQAQGRALAVILHYLGDPYMHPRIDDFCRIAADAKLGVHLNSSFSYGFSDDRIESIIESGVTSLTVCLDGMKQETYQRTRWRGRIEWVKDNLRRLMRLRQARRRRYPVVEVQYLKFNHNIDELPMAFHFCQQLGVDHFSSRWGGLQNWSYFSPAGGMLEVKGWHDNGGCYWPWLFVTIDWKGNVVPCCEFRYPEILTGHDARFLGNVFERPLVEIWNSVSYRKIRRFVAKPRRGETEPELKDVFCYGCPRVCQTNISSIVKHAPEFSIEDVYGKELSNGPI
jgi:MoaA/NifB/PqqE/SkfB family radical SAM enzyme